MEDSNLIALAINMRRRQRRYHRGKATSDLIDAKRLEKEFDVEIERRESDRDKERTS